MGTVSNTPDYTLPLWLTHEWRIPINEGSGIIYLTTMLLIFCRGGSIAGWGDRGDD